MPSFTRDDGMMMGKYPEFVQQNVPFVQAEVPGSSLASRQSQ